MVYKLKPLELTLEFEDRIYELGDTIDIELSLAPNGDVDVREGRVDLVCEEVYTSAETGIKMGMGGSGSIQGGAVVKTTDYVPDVPLPPPDSRESVEQAFEREVREAVVRGEDEELFIRSKASRFHINSFKKINENQGSIFTSNESANETFIGFFIFDSHDWCFRRNRISLS